MEEQLKILNTKIELLQIKASKSEAIANKGNVETTQRHCDNLRALSKEVNELKLRIEQEKISKGEEVSEVSMWSEEIETKLEDVDTHVTKLVKCIEETVQQDDLAKKESGEKVLDIQREKQLAFERAQLELKLEFEKKS